MIELLAKRMRRIWDGHIQPLPGLQLALRMLAQLYICYMRIRASLYQRGICRTHRLPCYVISVGNLSIGGTGKTPMVLYLARALTVLGKKVVVISRGYRGRFEKVGGIVSDGHKVLVGTSDSGDEPQILARQLKGVPVIVDGNRFRAGQRACATFNPDVILLDDAFQHLKLHRDLDLVLVDACRPFGNGWTLPAGELREPAAAFKRGHAVIMTRCPTDAAARSPGIMADCNPLCRHTLGPLFHSRHVAVVREIIATGGTPKHSVPLAGRRVFAFSGVAKNQQFLDTLSGFACHVAGSVGFCDHHVYSEADLATIYRQIKKLAVDAIVTTEKDYVKLGSKTHWPVDLVIIGIDISWGDDKKRFHAFLEKHLDSEGLIV